MLRHPSSYRDPSGFVYREKGAFYRQINPVYFEEYHTAKNAGIYQKLFDKKWLIPHKEISVDEEKIIILPEQLDFISYPYEWSFSQYKHAAQLTLRIQIFLLENNFSLKDASAFNIAFHKGKAVFIDTLSIEQYKENAPWRALKQFNEHFFGPLLLAQKYGGQYLKTLQHSINGMALSEVKRQLPFTSRFHPTIYSHIHLLSKSDTKESSEKTESKEARLSKSSQIKMLLALEQHINTMTSKENTEWSSYYDQINYQEESFQAKKKLVKEWCAAIEARKIIDLGGNDGTFAKELLDQADQIMVSDIDQPAIDQCYLNQLKSKENKLLPIVCDLMQPSPAIGFHHKERDSFTSRVIDFQADVTMALALIHHITLTGNVPFEMSAAYFAKLTPYLIIEFPDREDSWVKFILDSKRDARHLFDDYTISAFAKAYQKKFKLLKSEKIEGTERTLFLFERYEG
jgi:hypothetical protein